jgi:hypothetical protein
MRKYLIPAIAIELLCILYLYVHFFLYYMSPARASVAIFLIFASSLILYWICFKDKTLSKQEKLAGLITASLPYLLIIAFIVMRV